MIELTPEAGARQLRDALQACGADVCLRWPSRTASAAELLELADRAGQALSGCGLTNGDVVALDRLDAADALPCLLAAWSLGLVVYPLSPREPAAQLERQLDQAGAGGVIEPVEKRTTATATWRGAHGRLRFRPRECNAPALPAAAATLLRSSGSGGQPKLIVHGLSQHLTAARSVITPLDLRPGDGWLLSLPHHHVGGLAIIFRALLASAELLLPDPGGSLAGTLAALEPTHISLVPTQLFRTLRDAPDRLAAPRLVLMGGGPLSTSLRRRALDEGIALAVSYGSTESTAMISLSARPEDVARPWSAGRPLPHRDVSLVEEGEEGEEGELRVRGPTLCLGYLAAGRLVDPRGADGWLATGDLGRIDPGGLLYVLGRRDRMFVSGGENIHPEEIEEALESIPGIDEAVVVVAGDDEFGQRPVAFIACATPAPRRPEVEAALRDRLPSFKIPDSFYHLPAADGSWKRRPADLLPLLATPERLRPL
ncbi:MAG: AMP-binding protein [Gemmatimonadetes bacterium]|uniref:AMP-binding protein n=1 Tax=Candidatus Kutchimonas denitrificans TaxID=3056748 RepID=A0AAE5CBZ9_9BACT|nr:AMP-binding protein [Gemmatimonadota bacterium]NIR73604.1 AMP-binding protein [Candidatus Kutchimonas denitrificans]NIR99563.1 AMP-binding protein [Gemmatimonadota bacterium]NIT65183.1 AMP-binding protein [Gemmatimonadota bacterium]NIV23716.1 AMP-binding protein [Gemmatimonadota bacterium]